MTIYIPGFIPITWGAFNGLWDKVTHMRTWHQSPKFNFLSSSYSGQNRVSFYATKSIFLPLPSLKTSADLFSICAPIWAGLAFAVYCPIPRKHSTPVVGCRCSHRKCSGTRVQKTIKNTKELREAGHEQNSNFDTDDLFIAFGKYPQSYWRQIYCLAGLYETDKNLFFSAYYIVLCTNVARIIRVRSQWVSSDNLKIWHSTSLMWVPWKLWYLINGAKEYLLSVLIIFKMAWVINLWRFFKPARHCKIPIWVQFANAVVTLAYK